MLTRALRGSAPGIVPSTAVAPARIRVTGARHHYGARVVLTGVDLELRAGEIYGLLGPNGAGKTTLMRAICGHLKLDRGTVRLDGADPRASSDARRRIGFVPQDIALYPYLTVRENLEVFARLAGLPQVDIAEAVTRILDRTGLAARAHQLCRTLSGGYQRRVNICASILHNPALLVLDEPTVGIDHDARHAIHALLDDQRRQGTAILLTTHDLDQAQTLSDRVGILLAGRLRVEGAPLALLQRHYGHRMELRATLGAVPDATGLRTLAALGLARSAADSSTWDALVAPGAVDLPNITRSLTAVGLPPRELRLRQPDLASLFTALMQTNGAS